MREAGIRQAHELGSAAEVAGIERQGEQRTVRRGYERKQARMGKSVRIQLVERLRRELFARYGNPE